ncbi:uncharacterized protein CTRU02_213305 [Colletotrichum truncatum]|uniref:Membrane protein n=1 Tax=Colletotrichum truncatum TaxID=5467 RepID=A0ACC3YKI3_COLTU|nr:uncharacterized protein CTRU02_12684 [Colletotrichum truncatum]KAF6784422.1 membrane protein [Colletotrichum truncatum]
MSSRNANEKPETEATQAARPPTQPKFEWFQNLFKFLCWTPPRCRYDPDREFPFTLALNLLFSFASVVTVANLYYAYPILNKIASDFGITYQKASLIPTLLQAGYGSGNLFLCPLGDLLRPRPLIIPLVLVSATIWLGLCVTTSFSAFCALSFLTGFTAVTPQLMVPLADALAPPARRVRAISIVFAGLMFGQVLPRILSGVVTEYTNWRNIFWLALGLQIFLLVLLWLFFPDYPPNDAEGLSYPQMLWSMLRLIFVQPILAYGCLTSMLSNAAMSSFWTTLTALLAAPPYDFSPMKIGLFSFVAIVPVAVVPLYSSLVIEHFVTYLPVSIALTCGLSGVAVGIFTGTFTLAGVVIQALAIDFGVDATSIAYRSAVYRAVPKSRNRVNVVYMTSAFIGQLIGTSAGNAIYAQGGWSRVGIAGMALLASCLVLTFVRGPRENGWIGWKGGYSVRK